MRLIQGITDQEAKGLADRVREISTKYIIIDDDDVFSTGYSFHMCWGMGERNFVLYSPALYSQEVREILKINGEITYLEMKTSFNRILKRFEKDL